jgi:hypothetical protein
MPFVANPRKAATDLVGKLLAELARPLSDGFVADDNAAGRQQLLHHAEVLVRDNGFSWQGAHYRSLSAVARTITGTAWSGPLFFGLKESRSATRHSLPLPARAGAPMDSSNAAG